MKLGHREQKTVKEDHAKQNTFANELKNGIDYEENVFDTSYFGLT